MDTFSFPPPLAKVVEGGLLSLSSSAENGCSQWTWSELTRVGFLAPHQKRSPLFSSVPRLRLSDPASLDQKEVLLPAGGLLFGRERPPAARKVGFCLYLGPGSRGTGPMRGRGSREGGQRRGRPMAKGAKRGAGEETVTPDESRHQRTNGRLLTYTYVRTSVCLELHKQQQKSPPFLFVYSWASKGGRDLCANTEG